jgi:hypothetical protein
MIAWKGSIWKSEAGQITLGHLFMMMAFIAPIEIVIMALNRSCSSVLRYVAGMPLAFGLSILIFWLNWQCGKHIWNWSQHYSAQIQNRFAASIFALNILWIIAGLAAGDQLARFVIRFVA